MVHDEVSRNRATVFEDEDSSGKGSDALMPQLAPEGWPGESATSNSDMARHPHALGSFARGVRFDQITGASALPRKGGAVNHRDSNRLLESKPNDSGAWPEVHVELNIEASIQDVFEVPERAPMRGAGVEMGDGRCKQAVSALHWSTYCGQAKLRS